MPDTDTIDGEVVESTAIEIRGPATLFRSDDPNTILNRASEVATSLAKVINERHLFTMIQGKKHVSVEGWTMLGSLLGVFPVISWTRPLENPGGWEARCEVVTRSGEVIGAAEAQCSRGENTWARRDDYSLRSMAQTRAVSKAMRVPLGFVMVLAGYEATPEEEIPQASPTDNARVTGKDAAAPEAKVGGEEDGASTSGTETSPPFLPDENPGEPERPRLMKLFHALGADLGLDHEGTKQLLGVTDSLTELTDRQVAALIKTLEMRVERQKAKAS